MPIKLSTEPQDRSQSKKVETITPQILLALPLRWRPQDRKLMETMITYDCGPTKAARKVNLPYTIATHYSNIKKMYRSGKFPGYLTRISEVPIPELIDLGYAKYPQDISILKLYDQGLTGPQISVELNVSQPVVWAAVDRCFKNYKLKHIPRRYTQRGTVSAINEVRTHNRKYGRRKKYRVSTGIKLSEIALQPAVTVSEWFKSNYSNLLSIMDCKANPANKDLWTDSINEYYLISLNSNDILNKSILDISRELLKIYKTFYTYTYPTTLNHLNRVYLPTTDPDSIYDEENNNSSYNSPFLYYDPDLYKIDNDICDICI